MNILFLDDNPWRTHAFKSALPSAQCVVDAPDCIDLLQQEDEWDIVFLDHDLGGEVYVDSDREDTGMEVVRWIVKNKPLIKNIIIHTCNPPAGGQMLAALTLAEYKARLAPFTILLGVLDEMLEE